jgi:formylglycine-generating enzyme required for sulfatase activity
VPSAKPHLAALIVGISASAFVVSCRSRDAAETNRPASPRSSASAVIAPRPVEEAPATAPGCPEGQAPIPGGEVWIGSEPHERYADDESPRFRTRLAPYCLDQTEVTTSAYRACVAKGECTAPNNRQFHCNDRYPERGDHPINCVTWTQANEYCRQQGRRLPTEAEWELAARGGQEYREYSWGDEPPDGRACWKRAYSCEVKSFPAGAFDLYDMTGNVWEWVEDFYGPYPWPPATGFSRVYRGGGWSRRFEKWMHTRLRNREAERFSGSHLGLRCASTPPGVSCPFGADGAGRCLAGVLERACDPPREWNGVRCAKPGEPRCREGWVEAPGHGCVPGEEQAPPGVDLAAEKAGVTRAPSPEFEADCRQNFKGRPHAYRYTGGTHRGRNLVSRSAGCKNRDVGVGFNSTCCP